VEGILAVVFVPTLVFLTIVAPIWLLLHYATKWKQTKALSSEDEKMLAELWEIANRMESRINTLETILDMKASDWRSKV
jgi:phage shock protein B